MLSQPVSSQRKPIRSFVHRQGSLSAQRKSALTRLLSVYSLCTDRGFLNLNEHFQHLAPITLEIGFGMGDNLLTQAQQHPEQNFLGIEVHKPGIANVLVAIENLKLDNIKIIYADAAEVFATCIAAQSLQKIQIFFPDPWPKKKHHKRRLIQPFFASLLQSKLTRTGQLELATDCSAYATHILATLEATAGLTNANGKNQFSHRPMQRQTTKFEKRGQALGHTIWDLVFFACHRTVTTPLCS